MYIEEQIDAAIAGLCSCGCGQPITDRSPSAWFAGEACAERWHGSRSPALRADMRAFVEALAVALAQAVADVWEIVRRYFDALAAEARRIIAAVRHAQQLRDVLEETTPRSFTRRDIARLFDVPERLLRDTTTTRRRPTDYRRVRR